GPAPGRHRRLLPQRGVLPGRAGPLRPGRRRQGGPADRPPARRPARRRGGGRRLLPRLRHPAGNPARVTRPPDTAPGPPQDTGPPPGTVPAPPADAGPRPGPSRPDDPGPPAATAPPGADRRRDPDADREEPTWTCSARPCSTARPPRNWNGFPCPRSSWPGTCGPTTPQSWPGRATRTYGGPSTWGTWPCRNPPPTRSWSR